MKIIAINGSPRTNGTTAELCESFLAGVLFYDKNAHVKMVNLSQLDYKGCISCFTCKRKGSTYGKCSLRDELYPLLEEVSLADGIVFGSPIYFGEVSSFMRAFIERLLYPYNSYEKGWKKISPKKMQTSMIYTMTTTKDGMHKANFGPCLEYLEKCIGKTFLPPNTMYSYDTYQFSDYAIYEAEVFDENAKLKRREEVFPQECQSAYLMGRDLAKKV